MKKNFIDCFNEKELHRHFAPSCALVSVKLFHVRKWGRIPNFISSVL